MQAQRESFQDAPRVMYLAVKAGKVLSYISLYVRMHLVNKYRFQLGLKERRDQGLGS